MINDSTKKKHWLNVPTRLMIIIPSLGLAGMFLALLFLHCDRDITAGDIIGVICFLCLSGYSILYAMFCCLVTTSDGIENYASFPFHTFMPWNKVQRIEPAPFGTVNMICAPKEGKRVNRVITISTFIEDWRQSSLVEEIKRYIPHVEIPEVLLNRQSTKFFHRSGTLLIYLTLSIVFLSIPSIFLSQMIFAQYKPYIDNAGFSIIVAALGGMERLLWFSQWREHETDFERIRKVALLFYITPLSAYFLALILGMVFYILPWHSELMESLASMLMFLLGLLQTRILLKVFGKFIGINQGAK